jgi:hypothetical protein
MTAKPLAGRSVDKELVGLVGQAPLGFRIRKIIAEYQYIITRNRARYQPKTLLKIKYTGGMLSSRAAPLVPRLNQA